MNAPMDGPGKITPPNPLPRQTEHGDARMELQRREFDDPKNKKRKAGHELEDLQDDTHVSVQGLILFLDNFLKSVTEKPKKSFDAASHPGEKTEEKQAPETQKNQPIANAKAAQAYQKTAQEGSGNILDTADQTIETHIGEMLDASDIRLIHTIQDHLKTLKDRGVEDLPIQHSESFLQSILKATEAALAQTAKQ